MVLCSWLAAPVIGQTETGELTSDTKTEAPPTQTNLPDDDFAPGLGIFALFMGILFLLTIGAGAMITAIILSFTAGLLVLGILTTSTLAGFLTKQPKVAVKLFILQTGGVLGLLSGTAIAFLAAMLCNIHLSYWSTAITGAFIGLVAGTVVAMLLNLAWEKALTLLKHHFGE